MPLVPTCETVNAAELIRLYGSSEPVSRLADEFQARAFGVGAGHVLVGYAVDAEAGAKRRTGLEVVLPESCKPSTKACINLLFGTSRAGPRCSRC